MMRIRRQTGILISLLLLELTSKNTLAVNSTLNQSPTSFDFSRFFTHYKQHYHHYQHRSSLHRQLRVLHDSLINPSNNNNNKRLNLHRKTGDVNVISGQLSKSENLNLPATIRYSDNRSVAGYHADQRRSGDIIVGYRLTTTSITTTTIPSYNRFHTGRRVCTRKTPPSISHHVNHEMRFVYTEVSSSSFICCPGWSQVTRINYGCNRPTCLAPCHNGGVCGPHAKCNCPKGFSGSQCQIDVDECVIEKPCAQLCRNLPGSYECHCRYGFQLQPDGQSCKQNDSDGIAFEARDLENDYSITTSTRKPGETKPHDTKNEVGDGELDKNYYVILRWLLKLEKQISRRKKQKIETVELTTKVNEAIEELLS